MEKESVKKFDLEAAFKALDEIAIPETKGIKANRVDLKERFSQKSAHEILVEDYYDVSSNEDLTEAQEEREGEVAQAKLARIEKIVDLDAETADDLLPSYVGKVIMQCPQCMTLFYKNPEDIEHSDENPDVVNLNEPCQHCGNTSGYTLIGKVDSVSEDEADNYEAAESGESSEEESELDLDFGEPTEEVSPESEEESTDELSGGELAELDLDLAEVENEESEEEKKEESLNLSKETSENETEHKSENLTLNEKTENESLNKSEEAVSENETENKSENLTLNEEIDKDLDAKLKAHNDYIEYLKNMISQEEEALKKTDNEEVKAAIQRRLDAFNADLEAALPDALKSEAEPTPEVAEEEQVEETSIEEPTEVQAEEEAPVEEQLTEEASEEEPKEDGGNEINYVEYKHSYCHILSQKLKAINYLVNVKKVDVKILKGYIFKLLKDPEVKWTEKEKEFKKNIEEKDDAYDILNYVKNSIEKAKTIKVKVDENGELIESLNEGFEGCVYEALNESLNKSEAAVSENETENSSENLTLNEDVDPEIEAIINSWNFDDISEALDLGDKEVANIIDSWGADSADSSSQTASSEDEPTKEDKPAPKDDIDAAVSACESLEECNKKPIEECNKAPLKEDAEEATVEETPVEGEEAVEEEPKEEAEEKTPLDVIKDKVDIHGEEDTLVIAEKGQLDNPEAPKIEVEATEEEKEILEPEFHEETSEEIPVEEPTEETSEEAPVEEQLTEDADAGLDQLLDSEEFKEPISEKEVEEYFDEAINLANKLENLEEASFNTHINEFLKEVYSNVKSFETTGCELKENKLFVEGKISFNSGKEKLTMFEFLPQYGDGKLFFEGYNKDFAESKAFTLNCTINESKELITESFGYSYTVNNSLVEGLK